MGDQQLPEHANNLANILSGSSLLAVIAGLLKGGTKYGELSRSQQDIEKRVEKCEASHAASGDKLERAAVALGKLDGTLTQMAASVKQLGESVERVHSRIDDVLSAK